MNCMNGKYGCGNQGSNGCDGRGSGGCRNNRGMAGNQPPYQERGYQRNGSQGNFAYQKNQFGCDEKACGQTNDPISGMQLAMGYVPLQTWNDVYCVEEALKRGTIFPALDLPFLGCVPRNCANGDRR